jgi:hypothetical protein
MYKFILVLFKNPIINFALAATLALTLFTYSKNTIELSFSFSKPELIAANSTEAPELKFYWKDKPINKDLYRVKVAIWNSGNAFIDFEDISKSYPIKLIVSSENEIISQSIISKSRDNLDVGVVGSRTIDEYSIVVHTEGDDAIEENDGFVVSVFYVGDPKIKLGASGRVKGMSGDFAVVDWSSIQYSTPYGISIFLAVMFITGSLLVISSKQLFIQNKIAHLVLYRTAMPGIGASLLIIILASIGGLIVPFYYGLNWIN